MILPLFALLAVTAAPSVPTVPADTIWKDGYAEIVHYSTTRPGRTKPYESTIEVRMKSGPAYIENAGGELGGPVGRVALPLMIFNPDLADSGSKKATLIFGGDLQPQIETVNNFNKGPAHILGEVFYDGLPVWLRGFELSRPTEFYVPLMPTLLSGDRTKAKPLAAKIQIVGPAGKPSETSHGGLEVDVRYEGKVDRLWFHPGPGHPLLVWEKADSTTLTFKKLERQPIN